jgi:hypothetical protein
MKPGGWKRLSLELIFDLFLSWRCQAASYRHLVTRIIFKLNRAAALAEWWQFTV